MRSVLVIRVYDARGNLVMEVEQPHEGETRSDYRDYTVDARPINISTTFVPIETAPGTDVPVDSLLKAYVRIAYSDDDERV